MTRASRPLVRALTLAALTALAAAPLLAAGDTAPAATVPAPRALIFADLPGEPFNWALALSREEQPPPLAFRVELDLLAPLGTGTGNAATYFAPFTKDGGSRAGEWAKAEERRVDKVAFGQAQSVLPGDDPLLLEAEPWADQAHCRFYPDLFAFKGWETTLPNLLQAIGLGRSWVVRGLAQSDPAAAKADCRRAIRLGRLLLEDDVTIIQNLVGVALVRMGADGLYALARKEGDGVTTTLAALVAGDATAIRLEYMRRMQQAPDLGPLIAPAETPAGRTLALKDDMLQRFVAQAKSSPARALRVEVMLPIHVAMHLAGEAQQKLARQTLEELAKDPDQMVAAAARWYLTAPLDPKLLEGSARPEGK